MSEATLLELFWYHHKNHHSDLDNSYVATCTFSERRALIVGMPVSKNFAYTKSLQTAKYCGVSGIITAHYIEL